MLTVAKLAIVVEDVIIDSEDARTLRFIYSEVRSLMWEQQSAL